MKENNTPKLAPGQSSAEPPAGWPKDVRPISMEGAALLGVDPDGKLYWAGEPVRTESRLNLTNAQTVIALLTAVAAVIGATAALAQAATSSIDFACRRNWLTSLCASGSIGMPALPTHLADPLPNRPRR
jgi:hypothetical protein